MYKNSSQKINPKNVHVNRKQVVGFVLLHNTLAEDNEEIVCSKVVNYELRIDMIKLRFMLRFLFKVGWDRII